MCETRVLYNTAMNIGLHHLVKKYKIGQLPSELISNNKFREFVNRFIYIVGFFSIIILLPQLLQILVSKNAKGVSLVTWVGFFISSSFWLFYGIIHREKPIILTNVLALAVDALVIASIIFYG